ncbi:MAG: diacylglycerol/lipid kinase family protein, partial [Anaerolineae bacterium]
TILIYNPAAGPWDMSRPLRRLSTYLEKSGWKSELVETTEPGEVTREARRAAERGVDLVLVAGGDGTINEAAHGLGGTSTTLGIVPVGTGNILAHQLRMPILSVVTPLYVKEVGDALLKSRVQRIDLGVANDRRFVCWAGVGLDAEIAAQMEPRPRHVKRLGTLPYIIAALSVASEFRGVRSNIMIEDRTFRTRALMIVASNIQLYAAFFQIAPHASMDDGLLDIFVFKGLGVGYALKYVVQSVGGRHLRSPDVMHALAANVEVETSPSVAVHLDGDPHGSTPTEIGLQPAALRLLVPPHAPQSLFSKRPEVL